MFPFPPSRSLIGGAIKQKCGVLYECGSRGQFPTIESFVFFQLIGVRYIVSRLHKCPSWLNRVFPFLPILFSIVYAPLCCLRALFWICVLKQKSSEIAFNIMCDKLSHSFYLFVSLSLPRSFLFFFLIYLFLFQFNALYAHWYVSWACISINILIYIHEMNFPFFPVITRLA